MRSGSGREVGAALSAKVRLGALRAARRRYPDDVPHSDRFGPARDKRGRDAVIRPAASPDGTLLDAATHPHQGEAK